MANPLPLALALLLALMPAQSAPPSLATLVERLDRDQPAKSLITRARLEKLLGITLDCTSPPGCLARDVGLADSRIGHVDLRSGEASGLLVLENITGTCLPLDDARSRYPGGYVANSCAHAQCWYYEVERPWGRLSLGLPERDDSTQCVRSVVMNID